MKTISPSGTLLAALLAGASPAAAGGSEEFEVNQCDAPGACVDVELGKSGQTTLSRQDGNHRVDVTVTLAPKPDGWPDEFLVGDRQADIETGEHNIVTDVDIRVDGCRIEQPWPRLMGMSMPYRALLSGGNGRWQLEIYGGDNADAYNVTHTFDTRRILARYIGWGPLYSETARYDIALDPEMFTEDCAAEKLYESSEPLGPRGD
jgi:hypothetical protein